MAKIVTKIIIPGRCCVPLLFFKLLNSCWFIEAKENLRDKALGRRFSPIRVYPRQDVTQFDIAPLCTLASNRPQHGTLMMRSDGATDNSTAVAVNGLLGAGGLSGLVETLREHVYRLNISMEHIINYGGPSGKVDANCVSLLFNLLVAHLIALR